MKTMRRLGKALVVSSLSAVLALGVMTLASPRAEALPPVLLCGPTFLWSCSGPGGPDVLFPGTICEKRIFERQTGLTCVPFSG